MLSPSGRTMFLIVQRTQDVIRLGGSPLPDRDVYPARDVKLFLAR